MGRQSLTKKCFEEAAYELGILRHNFYNLKHEQRAQLDELYLQKVIALPSIDLDHIIYEHNIGYIKKDEKTIEAIVTELAERELLHGRSS